MQLTEYLYKYKVKIVIFTQVIIIHKHAMNYINLIVVIIFYYLIIVIISLLLYIHCHNAVYIRTL